jgi:phage terminase large subunit-like protein
MAMAHDAKRMPSRQAEYENLILNRRVSTDNQFVSPVEWKACNAPPMDLHGVPLYGGLDLSSVSDLTACVLTGRTKGVWSVLPTFWLPSKGLREKSIKDHTPYDMWASKGYLETTPGNTVSYEFVARWLARKFAEYNIVRMGFDRWNMKHLKPWLLQAGLSEQFIEEHFVEFGQGTQSMSPALRDLEQLVLEKELAHGDHPVLNMCAICAVVESKDEANRKLSKNKSTGRIDGMVALTMAIGVAPLKTAGIDLSAMIA